MLILLFGITLICSLCTASCGTQRTNLPSLRRAFAATSISLTSLHFVTFSHPQEAFARNLPEATGATGTSRGMITALRPIVNMQSTVRQAVALLPDLSACQNALRSIPTDEKSFKRIFDEYSEGVSYKQVYKDQNAFVVYYTKGFDGPNRPSIEAEVCHIRMHEYHIIVY